MPEGKRTVDDNFKKIRDTMAGVEVTGYTLDFEEVKILGDYAFEWGTIRGTIRSRGEPRVDRPSYNVMRILQKQSDGQ